MYHTGIVNQDNQRIYYTIIDGHAIELFLCEEIDLTIDGWSDHSDLPMGVRAGVLRWCKRIWNEIVNEMEEGQQLYAEPYDDSHEATRVKWLTHLGFEFSGNGEYVFTKTVS